MDPGPIGAAISAVRDAALGRVRDERGVRVEDYLTALGSVTGEAVVVDAALFDIEHNDMTPGAGIFGDALNELLSGDSVEVSAADPASVVGVLREQLVPAVVGLHQFPRLQDLYQSVAGNVGGQAWGTVATSVPTDNWPMVLPIQMAFELRPTVAAAMATLAHDSDTDCPSRHVVCALALASGIAQTAEALDPLIGIRLSLDVVFGMSKMVPMSVEAIRRVAEEN